MLGRMIKVFISSILQRPSIFNEVFMLGGMKVHLFLQIYKEDTAYLRSFLCLVG